MDLANTLFLAAYGLLGFCTWKTLDAEYADQDTFDWTYHGIALFFFLVLLFFFI